LTELSNKESGKVDKVEHSNDLGRHTFGTNRTKHSQHTANNYGKSIWCNAFQRKKKDDRKEKGGIYGVLEAVPLKKKYSKQQSRGWLAGTRG
jgi:hypothetical protein